ncbi:recombinase family protein [Streptomyces sp. LZ34]
MFSDKKSGKNALRPEQKACHVFLDAGDTLVVPSPDRYGRSLQDLINMVAELSDRGIGFTSLHENLDTTTPGGRLVFHVVAALAEFIRELIVHGTREGLVDARARGRVGGRPTVGTEEVIRAARDLLPDPGRGTTHDRDAHARLRGDAQRHSGREGRDRRFGLRVDRSAPEPGLAPVPRCAAPLPGGRAAGGTVRLSGSSEPTG